jgi:hypothetical protein
VFWLGFGAILTTKCWRWNRIQALARGWLRRQWEVRLEWAVKAGEAHATGVLNSNGSTPPPPPTGGPRNKPRPATAQGSEGPLTGHRMRIGVAHVAHAATLDRPRPLPPGSPNPFGTPSGTPDRNIRIGSSVYAAARLLGIVGGMLPTTVAAVVAAYNQQVSALGRSIDWGSVAGMALGRDLLQAKTTLASQCVDAEDFDVESV